MFKNTKLSKLPILPKKIQRADCSIKIMQKSHNARPLQPHEIQMKVIHVHNIISQRLRQVI
jgi:hypothetical protein